ncbi:hypothetical protein BASA81_015966 [Batrachochytrium salamandrivorans]|nr:hypothetical protein BASA81_015966 [Batrachochytrium salamandrivorans]
MKLHLAAPPLSTAFIQTHGYFAFKAQPVLTLVGTRSSLVTHMFHHSDLIHWLYNMYAITTSAISLDLGLCQTSLIFVGGGIGGCLTQVLEHTLLRDAKGHSSLQPLWTSFWDLSVSAMDWITGTENLPPNVVGYFSTFFAPTYRICGASAGAFALTGAEVYLIVAAISRIMSGRDRLNRDARHRRLADLITMCFQHALTIGVQVAALFSPLHMTTDVANVWADSFPAHIGYSAHLGGFLTGFAIMAAMDASGFGSYPRRKHK